MPCDLQDSVLVEKIFLYSIVFMDPALTSELWVEVTNTSWKQKCWDPWHSSATKRALCSSGLLLLPGFQNEYIWDRAILSLQSAYWNVSKTGSFLGTNHWDFFIIPRLEKLTNTCMLSLYLDYKEEVGLKTILMWKRRSDLVPSLSPHNIYTDFPRRWTTVYVRVAIIYNSRSCPVTEVPISTLTYDPSDTQWYVWFPKGLEAINKKKKKTQMGIKFFWLWHSWHLCT